MTNIDISSDEIKSILHRAQEILKNKEKVTTTLMNSSNSQLSDQSFKQISPSSPSSTSTNNNETTTPSFNNSNDIILIKNEAAKNLINEQASSIKNKNRKTNSVVSTSNTATSNQTKSNLHKNNNKVNLSRSNSNLSLNLIDDNLNNILTQDGDRLREENELLNIKISKLRYELKSRDQTVEDLKANITQMYVNLENVQMARKHTQFDIDSLKSDVHRLNNEKLGYYEQLKKSLQENEEKNKKLQQAHHKCSEMNLIIDKLKAENEEANKQSMEIKMRALKEKEELIKHLEKIEQEIIMRERAMFNQQYEKLLIESCEKIRAEDAKSFNFLFISETDKIKKNYEAEIKELKEKQIESQKQLEEQQKVILATYNKDLNQQFELMSQVKLNEYQNEKNFLQKQLEEFKEMISNLTRDLKQEKEKSNEKSTELLSLNKQKFKLIAQLKQYQKEENSVKNDQDSKQQHDEICLKYESLLNELNDIKKREYQLTKFNSLSSQKENLEQMLDESQEMNQSLQNNLNEWSSTNKNIELMILNEQELNNQLIQNLNEWKESNAQLERSIIETQQIGENLRINIQKLKQDSEILKEECIKVKTNENDEPSQLESTMDNKKEIEMLKSLKEKLENDYNNLDTSKLQLECDIVALRNDLEIISDKKDSLESQFQSLKEKYDEQVEINNKLLTLNEIVSKDLKFINEKIDHLNESKLDLINETKELETNILELQDLNKLLNNNLIEWKDANAIIQNQIISFQEQNKNLTNDLVSLECKSENKSNDQINKLKYEVDFISKENEGLTLKINGLNIDMDRLKFENCSLITQLNELKSLFKERTQLESSLDDLKNKNEILGLNLKEWQTVNKNIQDSVLNEQELNCQLMDSLNVWQNCNIQLQSANDSEVKKITSEINMLNLEKENFLQQLKTKDKEMHELIDKNNELETDIQKKEDELKYLRNIKESFDHEISSKVASKEIEINELKIKVADLDHREKTIDKYSEEINYLNQKLEASLLDIESKEILVDSLKSKIKAFDDFTIEKNATENKIIDLQTLNHELVSNLNEWKTTNKKIESLILVEQELNSNLLKNLSEWKESNSQFESEINTLKTQSDELNNQIKELLVANGHLETYQIELKRFNNEFNALKSENLALADQIGTLKKNLNQADDLKSEEIDTFISKIKVLTNLIEIKEKENQRLSSQIEKSEQNMSKLNAEIIQMTQQLNDKKTLRNLNEESLIFKGNFLFNFP